MLKKKSLPKVSLISESEEETKLCAQRLASQLKAGDIVFLQGNLGAGKTTFVKGLAQALKVSQKKVNSPTFVLMNHYKGKLPIYHFDLYRLEKAAEIDTLDFDEYFYGDGISLIEWPERLGNYAPKQYYLVEFQHKGENKRSVCISYPLKPQQKIFSLALNKDEKVLRYRNLTTALVLEDSILPTIDKMLDSTGIKFSQIDGFAIARGPGSFTSLRVGLSTIKAFAMSTGKPVVGIPTLDIIARGVNLGDNDEICVINDARRGKVYAYLYGSKGKTSDYLLTTLDDILEKVHGKTLFVGDALGLYRKNIEEAYQKHSSKKSSACKCYFADEKYWYPQAKVMASLAYERFKNKQYDDAANLLPLYLYPQDCQVTSNGR